MNIKILKFFLILFVCTAFSSVAVTTDEQNSHISPTPQMARKIKRAYDRNQMVKGFIYSVIDVNSPWEMEVKMEEMLSNPVIAVPIICSIFERYGEGDFAKMNLVEGFGFSIQEVNLAEKIYGIYQQELKKKQVEMSKQKEIEAYEKKQKELLEEQTLLNKWNQEGLEIITDFDDKHVIEPKVFVDLNSLSNRYDQLNLRPNFYNLETSHVFIKISENGEFIEINCEGPLADVIAKEDIVIEKPAQYKFNQLNKIINVPAVYPINLYEKLSRLGEMKATVKYDSKKDNWNVNLVLGNYNPNEDIENPIKGLKYNVNVSNSAKQAIESAIEKDIRDRESLKKDLSTGKHDVFFKLYNHIIKYGNQEIYAQPYVHITDIDRNK